MIVLSNVIIDSKSGYSGAGRGVHKKYVNKKTLLKINKGELNSRLCLSKINKFKPKTEKTVRYVWDYILMLQ